MNSSADNLVFDSHFGWIDPEIPILPALGVEIHEQGGPSGDQVVYHRRGEFMLVIPKGINPEILREIVDDYEERAAE